jgi:flagellar motor switch protein FliM
MDKNALSQEDIDALFQAQATAGSAPKASARAYDFRRSDRIPKEQIRALRSVHDTFARSLGSSLSAYLRTYVTVNLISVEQLSFSEFTSTLASPTCIATIGMHPFEGTGVLELNPSLAFPLMEILLGGGKVKPLVVVREMTIIEQRILGGLLALILQTLSLSWQSVATVNFSVESHESEPALLNVMGLNEAIVVIAIELSLGDTTGMMNIGIPSSVVKFLRQKFDQQYAARKANVADESARILSMVNHAQLAMDARVDGATVYFEDLLALQEGDILEFDIPIEQTVALRINGLTKYTGGIAVSNRKRAFVVQQRAENLATRVQGSAA